MENCNYFKAKWQKKINGNSSKKKKQPPQQQQTGKKTDSN